MPKKKTYAPDEKRPRGKQLDGRYRGKIKVGVDADGKDVYKYASGRTRPELAEALEELRKQYTFGVDKVDRDVLLSAFVEDWFTVYKKPHIAGSNLRCYRTILDAHYLPEFGDRQLRSIRPIELQRFLNDRADCKASYMKKIVMVGRQFFRRAVMDGVIDRDPTMGFIVPDCEEGSRRALTAEEQKAVLKTIDSEPNGIWVALLFCLGVRPGEGLGLQWGDFDFKARTVHIQRDIDYSNTTTGKIDGLKNDPSDRVIPMPAALVTLLTPRKGIKSAFVLQSPASGQWLTKKEADALWDRLMRLAYEEDNSLEHRRSNASVTQDEKKMLKRSIITPYYLRHNYATMLHAKGIDVVTASRWMGHKNVLTMMQFYMHLDKEREKVDASLLDGVFDTAL